MAKRADGMREHNHALALVGEMDASEVVGNRLYKIRYVATHSTSWKGKRTQKAWADKHGWTEDSYSQWETGRMGPSAVMIRIERAIELCEWSEDGITLDYIYRGLLGGLGRAWFLPLKDAPDRPGFVPPPPPRRRS